MINPDEYVQKNNDEALGSDMSFILELMRETRRGEGSEANGQLNRVAKIPVARGDFVKSTRCCGKNFCNCAGDECPLPYVDPSGEELSVLFFCLATLVLNLF